MNKLKGILVVISGMLLQPLQAQLDLAVSGGFRTGFVRSETFGKFADSYNSYYAASLTNQLDQFGIANGWGLNMDCEVSGFYGSLRFSRIRASEKVEFNTGARRHFDFSQFATVVGCGFGVHEDEFSFHLGIGLAGGTDRIRTYYEYADGTKSFGREKLLNGIYDGLHVSYAADMGLAIGISDGVMIYGQLEYFFGNVATAFKLNEWHYDKTLDPYTTYPIGLPTDYGEWAEKAPLFEYSIDDYVQADFNGLRIEVGLRFQIDAL